MIRLSRQRRFRQHVDWPKIKSKRSENEHRESVMPYSCSRIVWGEFLSPLEWTLGNLVFLRISITSEFLRSSSPSFCPDVKWLQMKQKLVWCNAMLIEIEPWKTQIKRIRVQLFFPSSSQFCYQIHKKENVPCFRDNPSILCPHKTLWDCEHHL